MSRKRDDITLPESLPESHPDYAGRERYDVQQAARYLDICVDIVYRAVAGFEIEHRRDGRRGPVKFTQADLDHWRAARRAPMSTRSGRVAGALHTMRKAKGGRLVGIADVLPKVRRFH